MTDPWITFRNAGDGPPATPLNGENLNTMQVQAREEVRELAAGQGVNPYELADAQPGQVPTPDGAGGFAPLSVATESDLAAKVSAETIGKGDALAPVRGDTVMFDLRTMFEAGVNPATATPTQVLAAIHAGLALSASTGGWLVIPHSVDPWTVSGTIVPPPNSRMMAPGGYDLFHGMSGASRGLGSSNFPPSGISIGRSWIRLAAGANVPLLANDHDNSQGKRGPAYGNGAYQQRFTALGITFDANGRNQTVETDAIRCRDAWAMSFPHCTLIQPRGRGWVFSNCNACVAPGMKGVGASENIANGTGDTAGTTTVSNATGSWAVGDLIAGPGIAGGSYVTAVSGSTLTLSRATTATANGVDLSRQYYFTSVMLVLEDSTTDTFLTDVDMHGSRVGLLLDSAYGCQVSGQVGYSIGGHNVWFRNTLTASPNYIGGCSGNAIRLRPEQATKHNVRLDQGCNNNVVDINAFSPGLFTTPADADGGWASVYDDGHGNVLRGVGWRGPSQGPTVSAVVAYGPNSRGGNPSGMRGGSDLTAGTQLVSRRPTSASAPGDVFSNLSIGPPPFLVPFRDFSAVEGSPAETTFSSNRHRCLAFPAAADTAAVAYVIVPFGVRRCQFRPKLVSLDGTKSGAAYISLGLSDWHSSGDIMVADETTLGPSAVAFSATTNQLIAAFSWGGSQALLVPGFLVGIRFRRVGTNAADTLAASIGLLGVEVVPLTEA